MLVSGTSQVDVLGIAGSGYSTACFLRVINGEQSGFEAGASGGESHAESATGAGSQNGGAIVSLSIIALGRYSADEGYGQRTG